MLWLTTAVGILGVVPQFACICPGGTQRIQPLFANSECGTCAKANRISIAQPTVPKQASCCSKCCGTVNNDAGPTCTEGQCLKLISVADLALVTASHEIVSLNVEMVSFVTCNDFLAADSLKHSPVADRSPPPPDLVALGHLVI